MVKEIDKDLMQKYPVTARIHQRMRDNGSPEEHHSPVLGPLRRGLDTGVVIGENILGFGAEMARETQRIFGWGIGDFLALGEGLAYGLIALGVGTIVGVSTGLVGEVVQLVDGSVNAVGKGIRRVGHNA